MVSLHATGTAMYITCLPEPPLPLVKAGKSWAHPDQQQVLRAQKLLNDAVVNNRQHYHLIQKVIKLVSNYYYKTKYNYFIYLIYRKMNLKIRLLIVPEKLLYLI